MPKFRCELGRDCCRAQKDGSGRSITASSALCKGLTQCCSQLLCSACFDKHMGRPRMIVPLGGGRTISRCVFANRPVTYTEQKIRARVAASAPGPKPRTLGDLERSCIHALLELGDLPWWRSALENRNGFQVARRTEHCHTCKRELVVHAVVTNTRFVCFVCAERHEGLRHTPAASRFSWARQDELRAVIAALEEHGAAVGPASSRLGLTQPHITPECFYDASLQDRPMTISDLRNALGSLMVQELKLRLQEAGVITTTADAQLVEKLLTSARDGQNYQLKMFSTAKDGVTGWVHGVRKATGEQALPEMYAHLSVANSTVWHVNVGSGADSGSRIRAECGSARTIAYSVDCSPQPANLGAKVLAKWLLFHALRLARADECLRAMGFAGGVAECPMLTEAQLDRLVQECPEAVMLLEQRHGDQVFVPAGWLHVVINTAPNFKVAYGFIELTELPTYIQFYKLVASALTANAKDEMGVERLLLRLAASRFRLVR